MRVAGSGARIVPRRTPVERMGRMGTAGNAEETIDDALAQIVILMRKYPAPTILGALGVGLLIGIILGRR